MQLSSEDPPGLLRAFMTACALATAVYDDVDLDARDAMADVDPAEVAFALASMLGALLRGIAPDRARSLLAHWGEATAAKAAQLAVADAG